MFEVRIVGRIPFLIISAIQNAEQILLTIAQQPIQSAAEFFRGDLPAIARTHRRQSISLCQSSFQTSHLPIKFDLTRSEISPGQICERKLSRRKNSLVRQIVDRHDCPWRSPLPFLILKVLDEKWRKG